jgi:hypothetical protein
MTGYLAPIDADKHSPSPMIIQQLEADLALVRTAAEHQKRFMSWMLDFLIDSQRDGGFKMIKPDDQKLIAMRTVNLEMLMRPRPVQANPNVTHVTLCEEIVLESTDPVIKLKQDVYLARHEVRENTRFLAVKFLPVINTMWEVWQLRHDTPWRQELQNLIKGVTQMQSFTALEQFSQLESLLPFYIE